MTAVPFRIRITAVCRVVPSDFFRDLMVAVEVEGTGISEADLVLYMSPMQTVN
jgi:hypothetical protein